MIPKNIAKMGTFSPHVAYIFLVPHVSCQTVFVMPSMHWLLKQNYFRRFGIDGSFSCAMTEPFQEQGFLELICLHISCNILNVLALYM